MRNWKNTNKFTNGNFNKSRFNKNEKLTIDWVINQSKKGKPIFTDEVLTTIGVNGLKKVMKELEKFGISTFTNFSDRMVVFIREDNSNLTVSEDDNWRVGFINNNDNIMFLPSTPKNI